jgi:DeoR family transcriptional regulator, aga operon transcriptional repressor
MVQKPLLAVERQRLILDILEREGVVRNAELKELLKVSLVTIRADLRELENQGALGIVHGGAVSRRPASDTEQLIDIRLGQNAERKRRIGARAAQLVKAEQTLIVDAGTTTIELINHLSPELDYVQIVTHGLNIAMAASRFANVEVVVPGGMVRPLTLAIVGPQVLGFLEMINADCVFLATNGFSPEYGLTTANILEVEVKRKIVQRAEKVVLLADSSKYGKRQSLTIVPMDSVDLVITDKDLDDAAAERLERLGIEVLRV